MKDLFVSYEQALELKQLGMDLGWDNYLQFYDSSTKEFCDIMKDVTAPLKTQVLKWFREKHNLLYDIVFFREDKRTKKGYWYKIYKWNTDMVKREIISDDSYFYTYEEAEMACINKLIEIIKTQ
jgi:hypothetical protein